MIYLSNQILRADIMNAITIFNYIISLLFALCYAYQIFYVLVGLFRRPTKFKAKTNHRYAVVISARNERNVIGNLIKSINEQSYPSELTHTYVIADNCTDDTAEVARKAGATVYERTNNKLIGKGYALDWFFDIMKKDGNDSDYDGYIIIDADNVLDKNFVAEMNNVFDNGYRVVTSYRNSKNYGENWITAGYSLWFIREARYLNNARMQLGTSCAISGTGFLVSSEILRKNGGWIHHLLTEDIEFTTDCIIKGEKIGYCADAVLYDEQPAKFQQSYAQRLRWAKGFYQVFMNYGMRLVKGILKGSFACYDMLMTLMPAMLLTVVSVTVNLLAIPMGLFSNSITGLFGVLAPFAQTLGYIFAMFFALGFITTVTEWKQIYCSRFKKLWYTITFPLFMMTYIPISLIALFRKVEWTPIEHTVSKTVDDICNEENTLNN